MKKSILLFCVYILSSSVTKSQIISTYAGTGAASFTGDGGPATAADLNGPSDIIVDDSANVYFIDGGNNRVRKINSKGIVSTFAGDGAKVYVGDGYPATANGLNAPGGVAIDKKGNIYIADTYNEQVRKVNTSGIMTTIAGTGANGYSGDGGQATAAEFNYPQGLAVDDTGNIYIADVYNNRVRKVNTNGIITTVAGNGTSGYNGDGGPATAARLYEPLRMIFDSVGNLYIDDWWNSCVRKVNSGGIISTIVGKGTGNAGNTGDGGPATAAKLSFPKGIAFDKAGDLYIADFLNNRVRVINAKGIITDFAGKYGITGFAGDGGWADQATFDNPLQMAADDSGNVYICDADNNRIRKVSRSVKPVAFFTENDSTVCANDSIHFADTSLHHATIWAWTFAGGHPATSSLKNPAVNYTVSGVHKVSLIVSNLAGTDSISKNITINVNPLPAVTVSASDSICYGASQVLNVGGSGTYLWSTGQTTSRINVQPLYTTTYSVSVNNGTCTKDTTTVIMVPYPITIYASNSTNMCPGNSNVLNASGSYSNYVWSPAAGLNVTTGASVQTTPSVTTTYSVTGKNGMGCVDTETIVVVINNPSDFSVFAEKDSVCPGMPDTLIATGGQTYAWSNGATNSSVIVYPFGTATYTVTINGGKCPGTVLTDTVNGYGFLNASLSASADSIYPGDSVILTLITSPGASYTWSTGQTTSNIVVLPDTSTTYWVYAASSCGYADTLGIRITVKPTSVQNLSQQFVSVVVFPNPFTTSTSVVFNTDGKHYIEVNDVTGRTIENIECTGKQYELSGNNLAKGVYFIKACNADKSNVAVTKVVLQ
ncbi:MAG TPA: T9SS type A sorting domain-containing protein [Bacteroidia bacterium]|nr:T9SS type A sorting domain-containing protein [Bacteroidia bacterium]